MAIQPPTPAELQSFRSLATIAEVAALLNTSQKRLIFNLYGAQRPRYRLFKIPKATGGQRQIASPPPLIAIFQRKLLSCLTECLSPKDGVHGFTLGRSVVTNAKEHLRSNLVLNLDLLNFFPTFHFGRVRGLFRSKPFSFPTPVATVLAQLCCHEGKLPQGAPTSPIISNFICRGLDRDLARFAKTHACVYTRYADDITISTNAARFPDEIVATPPTLKNPSPELGAVLLQILVKHSVKPNLAKTRMRRKTERQEVTAIVINEKINVRRAYVRNIRSILHDCEVKGVVVATARFCQIDSRTRFRRMPDLFEHLYGKLDYLKMVRGADDPLFARYAIRLEKLAEAKRYGVPIFGRALDRNDIVEEAVWILLAFDALGAEVCQATAFSLEGIGFVSAAHVLTQGRILRATQWELRNAANPGKTVPVIGFKVHPAFDLAVLEVAATTAAAASFRRDAIKPKVGDEVRIVGFPQWSNSADRMFIAPTRVIQTKVITTHSYILTGGPVRGGNSGGPFLSKAGFVVGVILWDNRSPIAPDGGLLIDLIDQAANSPSQPP
jgi:RNA-directed DNA polymerase